MPAKSLFTVEDMEVLNGDEMQSSRVRRAHYYKTFDSIAVKSISNIKYQISPYTVTVLGAHGTPYWDRSL